MTNTENMFMVVYQFKFWREKFKIVSQPELSRGSWYQLDRQATVVPTSVGTNPVLGSK